MKALTKPLLYLLISAVALYLVFVYIAQLSARQSVVLAVLFAFLLDGAIHATPRPSLKFTPYWIRVYPKWHEILTDFKLIQSPEEWQTTCESSGSVTSREFSVFRDAVWFSVLRLQSESQETLIYLNIYKTFVGAVDIIEDLDPVAITKDDEQFEPLRTQRVRFFANSGSDGYQLGLEVPVWWWDVNRASCPTITSEKKNWMCGTVRIVLATLPYREFDVYWDPLDVADIWDSKFGAKVHKTKDEYRRKFEWVESEPGPDDVPIPWTEINNRYFDVHHKQL
jgi:hypothetical protein